VITTYQVLIRRCLIRWYCGIDVHAKSSYFGIMGYYGGVAGTNRTPVSVAVAVAFSVVIMLIADLDRPGEGFVNVSQQAMIDVRDSIAQTKP
jgi:hypothetical protein